MKTIFLDTPQEKNAQPKASAVLTLSGGRTVARPLSGFGKSEN
jgi:hypothetical protein